MHQASPSDKESNRCSEHECDADRCLDNGTQKRFVRLPSPCLHSRCFCQWNGFALDPYSLKVASAVRRPK